MGFKSGYIIGRLLKIFTISILIVATLFVCGFFINSTRVIPDNVQIYIDGVNKKYVTPPCVDPKQMDIFKNLEHYPKNNVPEKYQDYTSEGECTTDSLIAKSNLTKDIFGIGRNPMSRWDSNGYWLW